MVVTVGAINKKDVNNLYKDSEKTGGEKPIDLIRATRPILIVDEPQSVDGGLEGQGKEALGAMNPLCTLRYSATHADKHHMVYRLDAVDAYERKLVKQIEVASLEVEGGHNKAYVQAALDQQQAGCLLPPRLSWTCSGHRREPRRRSPCRPATIFSSSPGARSMPTAIGRIFGCKGRRICRTEVIWRRALAATRPGDWRCGRRRAQAADDPPDHQGASGQGTSACARRASRC